MLLSSRYTAALHADIRSPLTLSTAGLRLLEWRQILLIYDFHFVASPRFAHMPMPPAVFRSYYAQARYRVLVRRERSMKGALELLAARLYVEGRHIVTAEW